ncbi:hypothetical protein K7432_015752 [Basidiobolus ranarum]|uniref:Uncharacterized protein n=1 Tax=Basidiobolus ranarum TaxID=34480 RepID=A0ABR2WFV9_9FUNG
MRFILPLSILFCSIFSALAAPLPLDAVVKVDTESTGRCNDVNAKINVLNLNVTAIVCLEKNQVLPIGVVPNSRTECPDIDAEIKALGLDIQAIICLKDGIKVFVGIR